MTRIVLSGPGAEDARRPVWTHLVTSLRATGHNVWPVDLKESRANAKTADPLPQWEWLINDWRPELVVTLPGDENVAFISVAHQAGTAHLELTPSGLGFGNSAVAPAIHLPLFSHSRDTPEVVDLVFVGVATRARLATIKQLVQEGIKIEVWGDGWQDQGLECQHRSAPPAIQLAATIRRGRFALALALGDDKVEGYNDDVMQALEAVAAGRVVLASSGSNAAELLGEACVAFSEPTDIAELVQATTDITCAQLSEGGLEIAAANDWVQRWNQLGVKPLTSVHAVDRSPRVSIITSCYNVGELLPTCIESVLNQTFNDFELLIIDDGSKDGTRSVIERYQGDQRIKVLSQSNIGQTDRFDYLWNRALENTTGELTAWIGSDDLFDPRRLEHQVARFDEDCELDIAHSAGIEVNDRGVYGSTMFDLGEAYNGHTLARILLSANVVAAPTIMVKRSVYERIGPWEKGFSCDYQYWLKAAGRAKFGFLPQRLMAYRVHEKSASTSTTGLDRAWDQGIRTRRDERSRRAIVDLYPELLHYPITEQTLAAAYTDLGVKLAYHRDFEGAVLEFDRVRLLIPNDPVGEVNRVIIGAFVGEDDDDDDVMPTIERLSPKSSAIESIRRAVDATGDISTLHLLGYEHFFSELFDADLGPTWRWDGTSTSIRRILLISDWKDPQASAFTINGFLDRFSAGDKIELMMPSLGCDDDIVLAALEPLLANRPDIESRGSITVDQIDSVELIPLSTYALVVDTLQPAIGSAESQHAITTALDLIAEHLTR